jgi:acyl-CoA thioesterase-2
MTSDGPVTNKGAAATSTRRGASPKRLHAIEQLLSILDLETLEQNLFRGTGPREGWQRVYGGQVLGQALVAACRTMEDAARTAHSMHAYFLLPGDPAVPIIYEVERVRDGASFSTRRVKAIQRGRQIFDMMASFHKTEAGFEHQASMPDVPMPEDLPSDRALKERLMEHLPENMRSYWERPRPIEMKPVDIQRYLDRGHRASVQHWWMRASAPLPDSFPLHQCVLAYASDFTLLDTALVMHGKLSFDVDVQLATIDHAIWFHRPFRADEWLLYTQDSPSAAGARGFCRGSVFTRDGRLVASMTQEGLTRPNPTAYVVS